jgi:hypothetical protein
MLVVGCGQTKISPPDAPPDEAEMQRMMAIAARYGNEILGPPLGQEEHFVNLRKCPGTS